MSESTRQCASLHVFAADHRRRVVSLYAELSSDTEAPTTKYYYSTTYHVSCPKKARSLEQIANSLDYFGGQSQNYRMAAEELDKLDINDNAIESQNTVICNRY